MNIQEEAKKYAEGKIISAMEQAVADAYIKGYNAACEEMNNQKNKLIEINGVEFIDLGLPSGTLWSTRLLNYGHTLLTYEESQQYSIPTPDQWEELKDACVFQSVSDGIDILSKNGDVIHLRATEAYEDGERYVSFWLLNSNPLYGGNCVIIRRKSERSFSYGQSAKSVVEFTGLRLPILLVKAKE